MTLASISRLIDNEQNVTGSSKWMLKKVKFEGDRIKKFETNLKGQSPIEIEVERNRYRNRKIQKDIDRDREVDKQTDTERRVWKRTKAIKEH